MARYLAIDWDHGQLHVVAATVRGTAVQIQRAAVWEVPQVPNPAEAEALGRQLRERLKEGGFSPAPVLACVGRDRVVLKEVRYPAVPEAEEPAVVRFQAVKELTEPADEVVIDYAAAPNGGTERRALTPILRRELLQAYQALCQAAGLKLVGLTPRPFGIAACVKHPAEAAAAESGAVAVLAVAGRWAEFCVVRGTALVFARTAAVGAGLAGEVRRNLAVYAGQSPQAPIRAVYLAGGDELIELRERLRTLLPVPVQTFDPFGGTERPELPVTGRGSFAGAAGLLYAQASGAGLPINFVRVKQPGPKHDPNRKRVLLAAGLALAVLLAGGSWCYSQLNAADAELANLTAVNASLDSRLVPLEEEAKYYKALSDWDNTNVVWLDELYDVTGRFPEDSKVQLMEFRGIPAARTGKDKHVAVLTLSGITSEDRLAKSLMQSLDDDSRYYRVLPVEITSNTTGVGMFQQLRRKFTGHIDIEKRPVTDYHRVLTLPNKGQPDGDAGGMGGFGGFGGGF